MSDGVLQRIEIEQKDIFPINSVFTQLHLNNDELVAHIKAALK